MRLTAYQICSILYKQRSTSLLFSRAQHTHSCTHFLLAVTQFSLYSECPLKALPENSVHLQRDEAQRAK